MPKIHGPVIIFVTQNSRNLSTFSQVSSKATDISYAWKDFEADSMIISDQAIELLKNNGWKLVESTPVNDYVALSSGKRDLWWCIFHCIYVVFLVFFRRILSCFVELQIGENWRGRIWWVKWRDEKLTPFCDYLNCCTHPNWFLTKTHHGLVYY